MDASETIQSPAAPIIEMSATQATPVTVTDDHVIEAATAAPMQDSAAVPAFLTPAPAPVNETHAIDHMTIIGIVKDQVAEALRRAVARIGTVATRAEQDMAIEFHREMRALHDVVVAAEFDLEKLFGR